MTDAEKAHKCKNYSWNSTGAEQTTLCAYLTLAEAEILAWLYSGNTPDDVTDVPTRYEGDADHGRCSGVQHARRGGADITLRTEFHEAGNMRTWWHM